MLGSLCAQVLEGATLHDGEQALLIAIERFGGIELLDATLQPMLGEFEALLRILPVALPGWTFIECHHDVGADDALCVDDILWSEEMLRAIDMGTKLTTFAS